ncbi:MAG: hypothetical protein ABJB11_15390 [Ferruginibacter sp.]
MKKILIIYPHFPPSNLAGVHRPRLFAQHLPSFGWEPVILTVHEKFYEETLDYNLEKLLPKDLRIEKVSAFKLTKPRSIGDIGLRAFFQLYKKAKQIIQSEKIDFLLIPIPSFYVALLGRWLHSSTGIKYGIDYIDPWVHHFPGSNRLLSRHWLSMKIAGFLEPVAVKMASLITGVAAGYYEGVLKRNPFLLQKAVTGAMPYGGEVSDHQRFTELNIAPYLFNKKEGKLQLVYAGAMLPKAYGPLEAIFKSIVASPTSFQQVEFIFIGTGSRANDASSFNVKPLAVRYGLWESIVYEYPQRYPYLDIIAHLNAADGIFILGSTEPHYTPSKVYQGVMAEKPILAVLHAASSAKSVIEESGAGKVLAFDGENDVLFVENNFATEFDGYVSFLKDYNAVTVKMHLFQQYSAYNVTASLAKLLNEAIRN